MTDKFIECNAVSISIGANRYFKFDEHWHQLEKWFVADGTAWRFRQVLNIEIVNELEMVRIAHNVAPKFTKFPVLDDDFAFVEASHD